MTDDFSAAHRAILDTVPVRPGARIETETVPYEHVLDPHAAGSDAAGSDAAGGATALEGYLAHDAALTGRRPGVLIVHDWTGVGPNVRMRAQMLARLGYVALAADVYGAGVHPTGEAAAAEAKKYYADLPLLRGRVRAGFDRLAADPRVDPNRIAVMGYCFGGSAALEFARTGAPARAVVTFHGGLIAHEPSDASAIRASLLVLTGAADPVVPDSALDAFKDELRAVPELDWQVTSYSGAPHAFTVPGSDRYRPVADARSWRALVDFLAEVLA